MTDMPPELPAYRLAFPEPDQDLLLIWCEHERRWHSHGAVAKEPGAGNGPRVAHCRCSSSPYERRGYVLREVGPMTDAVRRRHRVTRARRCPTCHPSGRRTTNGDRS